ncbi:hypothetical protein Q9233_014679 [Columba guinea]|nr:hypothetical protein Q9233_014679 [Columba guinea]
MRTSVLEESSAQRIDQTTFLAYTTKLNKFPVFKFDDDLKYRCMPTMKLNELLEDFYITMKKTDGSDFLARKLKEKLEVPSKAGMAGAHSCNVACFSLSDEEEMWETRCLGDYSSIALMSTVVKHNS